MAQPAEQKNKNGLIYRTYSGDGGEDGAVRMSSIDKKRHEAEFIITTEAPVKDLYYGPPRVLSMKGASFKEYRKNPVILVQHQHGPLEVIGNTIKVYTEKDRAIALARFDVDDEFSARVWGKIERGFVRAASVGFQVIRERLIEENKTDKATGLQGPVSIATQWKLHEWSVVAVGADSESLGRSDEGDGAGEEAGAAADDTRIRFMLPQLTTVQFRLH